jgi:hypothetical protein
MTERCPLAIPMTVGALVTALLSPAAAQAPATAQPSAPSKPAPARPVPVAAKRFPSAEEATRAFVAALRAGDKAALLGILGREGRSLITSGDPVADREGREAFLRAYDTAHAFVPRGSAMVLQVGADDWPFPIPLVPEGSGWRFDTRQGRDEILARRIGRNETNAIQTCLAYVDAQREYYAQDRNGDGILEYAQRFDSTPGQRDGLYWETSAGEPPSPLGPLVVRAHAAGYRRAKAGPTPYQGYLYRILTAQGPDAADGAYDYVVRGHMIAGFGLVAFPAQYGASGVMTFVVNHDGDVYQKDLGPTTRAVAAAMKTFDPDTTWTKVDVP